VAQVATVQKILREAGGSASTATVSSVLANLDRMKRAGLIEKEEYDAAVAALRKRLETS